MTEMRRLEPLQKGGVYERGRSSAVRSFDVTKDEVERLQKERPELIVEEEAGVILLSPERDVAWLHYGFGSVDALRQHFRPLLEKLVVALKKGEAPSGILLRFTDQPNRSYVEPVLVESFFELQREWMEMKLIELPDERTPGDEVAPGFVLRLATPEDYDAVADLAREAFAERMQRPFDAAYYAEGDNELRVLAEKKSGRMAGCIGLNRREERTGDIAVVAVHPDCQRRGLGDAMLRWSFARFRQQGKRRARLFVDMENTAAIALYRKLGFAPGQIGLTYRRPTDDKELKAMAQKKKGTHIVFGNWR